MIHHQTSILESLISICGVAYVFAERDDLLPYEADQSLSGKYCFDILVKPGNSAEIAEILKLGGTYNIPITPRGGGSGVTGGALPIQGGIVLSLERLNKVININKEERYVVAESGVVTADLCKVVEQEGLYFPVAPSSSSFSFIGGNVAENAGSINSCKYGKTAEYVLNLEVVLTTGVIIWTSTNIQKKSVGLNLTQLFIGTEGTMGIITKIVYKLLPAPTKRILLLTAFTNLREACDAIVAIKRLNFLPSAVELITENALRFTAASLNKTMPLVEEHIKAHLLVALEENNDARINDCMADLLPLLEQRTTEEILVASTERERAELMKLRFSIGYALTSRGYSYRDIDVTVPVSALYDFLQQVEVICSRLNVSVACFGHALDGNLHTMLFGNKTAGYSETDEFKMAVYQIYEYALAIGGVISGEHGIGILQKEFMRLQFSDTHLQLMKSIKDILDPKGILNPGKIL